MADSELWREYGISSSLEVKESEHYGRGVYAKTALSAGVEVMQAEPFAHVLSNDARGHFCDQCLRESQSLSRCGQCKFVRYCSKDCQAKDWQCHKGECKGIAMVRPNAPTPLMRLVVRALQKKSQQQASGKVFPEEGAQWEMDLLCSHGENLSSEVKEELATLMFGIQMILKSSNAINDDSASMHLAYDILCKALCNTFTIHKPDLDAIGAGLYSGPSLLNHCCLPNCIATFNGLTLAVRTIKPIQPGEQLLISYLELLDGLKQRQATLERTYTFQCSCERCQTEINPDSQWGMLHATVGNCSDSAASEAVRAAMDSLKIAEAHKKKGDWVDVVRECELSLTTQAPVLHHMHHLTAQTLQQLIYACIEVGDWHKAIEASQKLTGSLRCSLPHYHPVRGIHLLRLGKLHRLSGTTEDLQLSVKDLTQTTDQLVVVYGRSHPSTHEAFDLLQDSQRELGHRAA